MAKKPKMVHFLLTQDSLHRLTQRRPKNQTAADFIAEEVGGFIAEQLALSNGFPRTRDSEAPAGILSDRNGRMVGIIDDDGSGFCLNANRRDLLRKCEQFAERV